MEQNNKQKVCPNGCHSNGNPDCHCGEKFVEENNWEENKNWDYNGDIAIQICLMLDKTLPNKYSSSFLETLEKKIVKIISPKIKSLLSSHNQKLLEQIERFAKDMREKIDKHEYCKNEGERWENGYDCAMIDVLKLTKNLLTKEIK